MTMKTGMIAGSLAAVLLLLPLPVRADGTPSVLVRTVMPRQGSVPDVVTAYGTAGPSVDGNVTLSVAAEGQVTVLAARPGEAVQAGEKLIDFALSAQAVSTYHQAVAAARTARQARTHTADLFQQQLATRDQVEQADKAVFDAEARLNALQHETGDRNTVTLKAPFDGIVSAVPIAQGDRTPPGAPLVSLIRADGLVVTVGIEPSDRTRVHNGNPVRLNPLTGTAGAIDGRILRVDNMINAKSRLVDADISLPPGTLPGETFRAVITVGRSAGWLIPRDAVLADDKGAYLLQVAGDKAVRVEVRPLGTDGDIAAVTGAIDPQRPVVVEGNYQLSDGTAVRQEKPL
ncbi:MAG: efflux RND transporter periplasmic adaptor subunit [Telmatospirillum sp.]|nr:efflux RND transporter periplasmic adaptor subunit [Telmatospirillum sp.]